MKWGCVLLIISGIVGGYWAGIRSSKRFPNSSLPDTVVVHRVDTFVRTIVRPERVTLTRYVRDTLLVRDTVRAEVMVPIQKYVFSDSLFRAEVSGYRVSLDHMEVYRPTLTRTLVERVRVPKRWGIGLSAGYGWSKGGFSPYIGIGVNYQIISF